MPTYYFSAAEITPILAATFSDYRGRKARVEITAQRSYNAADLCWSGGTITYVKALRQTAAGLESVDLIAISPWSGQSWGGPIPDDIMLVEHRHFCGKDLGITCVVSPTSIFMPKFLPDPSYHTLTVEEVTVLQVHATFIASYRKEAYARAGLTPRLPPIIQTLADLGLLKVNKAGSSQITPAGKNALAALPASAKPVL